jgi:hypothetical protein
MTRYGWIGNAGVVLATVLIPCAGGCSNKGARAGKVQVVLSERLKQKGVSLEDWRYSESEKSFGVKLKASSPVDKQTYLTISGPGIGQVSSPIPVGDSINKEEWIDFGGTKALGNPFDNFPESGTITIDVK